MWPKQASDINDFIFVWLIAEIISCRSRLSWCQRGPVAHKEQLYCLKRAPVVEAFLVRLTWNRPLFLLWLQTAIVFFSFILLRHCTWFILVVCVCMTIIEVTHVVAIVFIISMCTCSSTVTIVSRSSSKKIPNMYSSSGREPNICNVNYLSEVRP